MTRTDDRLHAVRGEILHYLGDPASLGPAAREHHADGLLLAHRMARCTTLSERLFVLMTLGDDRAVAATHLLGQMAWCRDPDQDRQARQWLARDCADRNRHLN